MKRQMIKIDRELCDGCGLCVTACHEGAIGIVDGKAVLLREDFCDGLGNCLPVCPRGAIAFEEREAPAFDEDAVRRHMDAQKAPDAPAASPAGAETPRPFVCPGTKMRTMGQRLDREHDSAPAASDTQAQPSRLGQWPVQIKLVPPTAPYFQGAQLLIAADCTAYAYANMHERFMRGRITLIGCPKLDMTDYSEKLAAILAANDIKSLTVVRMEVPCCAGIVHAVTEAMRQSGKIIPWQVHTVGIDGDLLD